MTAVGDKPMKRVANPLLPDRFQQPDLFICDIFDAAPKSDMAGMEHPVFRFPRNRITTHGAMKTTTALSKSHRLQRDGDSVRPRHPDLLYLAAHRGFERETGCFQRR